jgi:hypothetical protein
LVREFTPRTIKVRVLQDPDLAAYSVVDLLRSPPREQARWGKLRTGWASEGVIIMTEAWEEKQKAGRVLGAAVAEAEGKPDEHVFALPVMRRAGVTNVEFSTSRAG